MEACEFDLLLNKFADRIDCVDFARANFLSSDMCMFAQSQSDESKAQSRAAASKNCKIRHIHVIK